VKRAMALVMVMLAASASGAGVAGASSRHIAQSITRGDEGQKTQWAPTRNFSGLNTRFVSAIESRKSAGPYAGERGETATGLGVARYYDSKLGVFLSRDSFEGNLNDSPSLHRYTYAHNLPLRYRDPNGRCVLGIGGKTCGERAEQWEESRAEYRQWLADELTGDVSTGKAVKLAAVTLAVELGAGLVDLGRLGEGAAEGTAGGFFRDTVRAVGAFMMLKGLARTSAEPMAGELEPATPGAGEPSLRVIAGEERMATQAELRSAQSTKVIPGEERMINAADRQALQAEKTSVEAPLKPDAVAPQPTAQATAESPPAEQEYLYRGVHAGHPALEAAKAGRVVPGNPEGTVSPELHNAGGPGVQADSPYTSWTRRPDIAQTHATKMGPGGVVLRTPVGAPPPEAKWNWEWSPDEFGEAEVLMKGTREGVEVLPKAEGATKPP